MKRIKGTYQYDISDEDAQYTENIEGAMFVQIDENVVSHDDSLNEKTVGTYNIVMSHEALDLTPEEVLQHLLALGPDDDESQMLILDYPHIADQVVDMVLRGEAEREVWQGVFHGIGADYNALCGAGPKALTFGDDSLVTCPKCLALLADDDGEFAGELARFTPMLNLLLEGNDYDAEVWENGHLLLLVLDRSEGLALGIADYVDEYWNVMLYVNHGVSPFHHGSENDIYLDVTESIGKVNASDGPDTQRELARRILWYLNTEQHAMDVRTLRDRASS